MSGLWDDFVMAQFYCLNNFVRTPIKVSAPAVDGQIVDNSGK